jgi:molybdopterin-guanine dinucleotide biosynthesis protein A
MTEALPGYILAGGRSRRFGSNKARMLVEGKPNILRLAELLSPHCSTLTAVAGPDESYLDLGLRTIHDPVAWQGPLVGVQRVLEDAPECWARQERSSRIPKALAEPWPLEAEGGWRLVVSCDLLEWHARWFERLIARLSPELAVVAFHDGRWQPFPALYHPRLLPSLVHCQRSSSPSFQSLFQQLGTAIGRIEGAIVPPLRTANTAEELRAWTERSSGGSLPS